MVSVRLNPAPVVGNMPGQRLGTIAGSAAGGFRTREGFGDISSQEGMLEYG